VEIRCLTADTHPDHDTICKFRRKNLKAFRESFVDVLELASELKLLKLGNLSLDDTHLKANASIDKNVNYQRAVKILAQLRLDIDELLAQAETADAEEQDNQKLPEMVGSVTTGAGGPKSPSMVRKLSGISLVSDWLGEIVHSISPRPLRLLAEFSAERALTPTGS